MMYVPTPEALWAFFISDILTTATLVYFLGVGALFALLIIILEFLDSTRGGNE